MASADEQTIQASFGQNLSYLVSITHSLLGKLTTEIYALRGLNTHQWKVMSILYYWPPIPAVRITSLCTLDKAAISRGVSGLLKMKLASRHLDEESGMICITLTQAGRAMYAEMAAEMAQLQKRLMATVSERDRNSFFATLLKIEQALRATSHAGASDQVKVRHRTTRRGAASAKRRGALDVGTRRARSGVSLKA